MVALLQMPCKSGCPSAVRGSFCARMFGPLRAMRTHAAKAVFLSIILFLFFGGASARQNIRHRIISLMTGIFIDTLRSLVERDAGRPGFGESRWIVDRKFILKDVWRYARKALRQVHVRVRSAEAIFADEIR